MSYILYIREQKYSRADCVGLPFRRDLCRSYTMMYFRHINQQVVNCLPCSTRSTTLVINNGLALHHSSLDGPFVVGFHLAPYEKRGHASAPSAFFLGQHCFDVRLYFFNHKLVSCLRLLEILTVEEKYKNLVKKVTISLMYFTSFVIFFLWCQKALLYCHLRPLFVMRKLDSSHIDCISLYKAK